MGLERVEMLVETSDSTPKQRVVWFQNLLYFAYNSIDLKTLVCTPFEVLVERCIVIVCHILVRVRLRD